MTAIPSTRLITIFGGSGFLGRHIVRALANDGWRIRVAVRRPNVANFLKPMGRVGQIQLLKTNVNDDAAVDAAMKGADAVVNLVGVLYQSGNQNFRGCMPKPLSGSRKRRRHVVSGGCCTCRRWERTRSRRRCMRGRRRMESNACGRRFRARRFFRAVGRVRAGG
jgi:hypothetical protein